MKIINTIARNVSIVLIGTALLLSTACSSSQQDDEELDVSNEQNEQGNLGEDDAAEGNNQQYENEFENEQYNEQGADVNSDTDNEFENENGGNQFADIDPTLDNSAGGNQMMNTSAPMNTSGMASPMAPAASERSPVPGGRVRYAKGTVQVVNAPGGSPVFTLETGDHPVTWEESGWLRLSTGMYVPVDAMSDRGVGRPSLGNGWN